MTAPVSHDEFFALLDIARFGACVASSDGIVVFWNRRAEQIIGISAARAVGRLYHDVMSSAQDALAEDSSESSFFRTSQASMRAAVEMAANSGETLAVYLFDGDDVRLSPLGRGIAAPTGPTHRRVSSPDAMASGRLTPRETQILRLVAEGITTEQIASDLDVSVHTVRNHVRSLRRKLNAKTKLDAVVAALRQRLL